MDNANGNGADKQPPWLQITITRQTADGDVVMAYNGPNLDEVINGLQQTLRHVEAQWRFDKAQRLAKSGLQAAADAKLAESIMGRRM